jgi:carboxylesterase
VITMSIEDRSIALSGGSTGVLLIHGLGGTPVEMRYVAVGLARAGFTVACPQLAGHCGSFDELRATGWRHWYASAETALERLRATCDTIVVGGLSMGAVLALGLAAKRKDSVQGAALFAPTLWLDGWSIPWYARLFGLVTSKRVADRFAFTERDPFGVKDPRVRALVTAAILSGDSSTAGQLSTPGSSMLELRWLVDEVRRNIGTIDQPVMVIHPREDDRASIGNMLYLQKNLAGPVESVILNDSYHLVTIDRQRHVVVERTACFVGRVEKQTTERVATASAIRSAQQTDPDAHPLSAA